MQLSVVIPAYNEASVISETVKDVLAYCNEKFLSFEIIVVDDGSTDKTVELVSKLPDVSLIRYSPNRGKGYAVKQGVLASKGDLILFMDADNSTNIRELDHFFIEIIKFDIVVGSRATASSRIAVSQNPLKKMLGRLGNRAIRLMLGLPYQDTQCGFKLFHKSVQDVFKRQTIERWGFDFEVLFLARKAGMTIYESGVTWVNNFDSKVSPLSYITVFFELFRIRVRYYLGKYS